MKIKVNCAFDKMVKVTDLKPNPKNPNKHPDKQIDLLVKIIQYQGWRNPIVISNRSGFIVKGHARRLAAIKLNTAEVPVDFQDYDSDEMELLDLVADNQIAELAEWNNSTLKDVLQEIDTGELDMDLSGFKEEEIEDLMTKYAVQDIDELLTELDLSEAIEKPIWLVIRTSKENQELVEISIQELEEKGIRVERSYEK